MQRNINNIHNVSCEEILSLFTCPELLEFKFNTEMNPALISLKKYTKEAGEEFILLLSEMTDCKNNNILEVKPLDDDNNHYLIVVHHNVIDNQLLRQMQATKNNKLSLVTSLLNQIDFSLEKEGQWVINKGMVCFHAVNPHFLETWKDGALEKELKNKINEYCQLRGVEISLNSNTLSRVEKRILKSRYMKSNAISILENDNNFYMLNLSPLYLIFLKIASLLKLNDYKLIDPISFAMNAEKKLGEGAFASVYSGVHNKKAVAIKCSNENNQSSYSSLKHEIRIFNFLSYVISNNPSENMNDYIIQYYGYNNTAANGQLKIVLELADSSLSTFLFKTNTVIVPSLQKEIACSIANGLYYLHEFQLVYGDLKPDNILLVHNKEKNNFVAKLSDFGTCKFDTEQGSYCGTPTYSAPEVLQKIAQTSKSDIYSFGVTLFEIVTKNRFKIDTFEGDNRAAEVKAYAHVVTNNKRAELPINCSDIFAKLITSSWNSNPEKRPTAAECITTLQKFRSTT